MTIRRVENFFPCVLALIGGIKWSRIQVLALFLTEHRGRYCRLLAESSTGSPDILQIRFLCHSSEYWQILRYTSWLCQWFKNGSSCPSNRCVRHISECKVAVFLVTWHCVYFSNSLIINISSLLAADIWTSNASEPSLRFHVMTIQWCTLHLENK